MATFELNPMFKNLNGKLNKRDKTVLRQKKYRSSTGAVISKAAHESYEVLNPRDYKKNPPKGAELQSISVFAQASSLTTRIIRSGKYTTDELAAMTDSEREEQLRLRAQLADFEARFMAQLKKPDPQAPVLAKTDPAFNPNSTKTQRKQYLTLNTFIRAMLIQSLK